MKSMIQMGVAVVVLALAIGNSNAGSLTTTKLVIRKVPAGKEYCAEMTFVGGVPTKVNLLGNGKTALNLYVEDDQGKVVMRGTGLVKDVKSLSFTPVAGKKYKLVVGNPDTFNSNTFTLKWD